jgi:hypothetical protein
MKRVGINFGDNDFGNTLRPFVQSLLDLHMYDPERIKRFTRGDIAWLFNEVAYGLYRMFQARDTKEVEVKHEERLRRYLRIDEHHVLVDDEVTEYYLEDWRHNSHFYWADFETEAVFYA